MNKNSRQRRHNVNKYLALVLVLTLAFPFMGYANVLSGSTGEVDTQLKHVGSTDWDTGRGRHDAVVRWAAGDSYYLKTVGMFGRGVSNTVAGWSEFFLQPIRWSKNSPVVVGQVNGLAMGLLMGTLRTLSGVVDITTCWIPWWRGIPMGKPALGLKDVHEFKTIEDPEAYNQSTKKSFFTEEKFS